MNNTYQHCYHAVEYLTFKYIIIILLTIKRNNNNNNNNNNNCNQGFLGKKFRGGKTKFSRNKGGQAEIHKIYVVHALSTCTSFSMLESENMTGLALVLICFNIFQVLIQHFFSML